MQSKTSQQKNLLKRILLSISIAFNVIFIFTGIYFLAMVNSGNLDFEILNFALNRENINYNAPGNCLSISEKYINDSETKLDPKGRVLNEDGNVECIVEITPEEADVFQQKLDSETAPSSN